jgi:DNA primase
VAISFPPRFLDELRNRLSVSELVGRKVRLIRKGREHSGLCPFHNEKTPSFTVNDEKGFYHCFGCGAHGDVVGFTMRSQSLSFPEAVERLASEAGLEVPRASPEEREKARHEATLHDAMEAACLYYEKALRTPDGLGALDYLRSRGLSEETIARFRLGFAPESRTAMKTTLLGNGITLEMLIEAGLLIAPEDGREPFDRFRGRVIFPITDRRGRVIAFGGRIMGDGQPKYLNSPDTPLFHKGHVLYGLAQARGPATEKKEVLVTEGYMDVIALSQAGFSNAVAPLGTALTESQIEILWKLAPEPTLCFDGDAAGQRAAARAAERALAILKPGCSLRFATLPAKEDPDSLIKSQGPQAMRSVLESAQALIDVLWRMETQGKAIDTPERRAALEKSLNDRASMVADHSVQEHYRRAFRERLWNEFRGKRGKASGFAGRAQSGRSSSLPPLPQPPPPDRRREAMLIGVIINHPEIAHGVEERLGLISFGDSELDKLRQEVLKHLHDVPDLDSVSLKTHLVETGFADTVRFVTGEAALGHAGFARIGATEAEAREGWDHTWELHQQLKGLEADIARAEERLANESSEEAFAVLTTLLEHRRRSEEWDWQDDVG